MYIDDEYEIDCILDGHHGVYVPQFFAQEFDMQAWHVDDEDVAILLAGPDHPEYWDAWDSVLRDAYFITDDGKTWVLEQDSDLFAICEKSQEEGE